MNTSANLPQYTVTLIRKGNTYTLRIPQLHLYAQGDDLEQVYKELADKQHELLAIAEETGTLDELPLPITPGTKTPLAREYIPFAIKSVIVAAIVGMFALLVTLQVGTSITGKIARMETIIAQISNPMKKISDAVRIVVTADPNKSAGHLERGFHRISEVFIAISNSINKMTPERQKELVDGMRRLSVTLKPIIDEARMLNDGVSTPCTSGTAKAGCPSDAKDR